VTPLNAVDDIELGYCGVNAIGIAIWLAAARISDIRTRRADLRRAARARHPSSGRWIRKPSATDGFAVLGDLPNP
ncbi:hypothetical protein ACFWWS_38260, partial [Streptomyces sp. NPDC059083]|uniref:hypothetical protein n=1 Tax=Streptomyces sp. NPDC059083 TaxID=3346721 RepID=UPI0036BB189D